MAQLNITDIKFPDPDSHFRLRPCECKSENLGYIQFRNGNAKLWMVKCFTCETTGVPFPARHDAQVYWNSNMAVMPQRRTTDDRVNS